MRIYDNPDYKDIRLFGDRSVFGVYELNGLSEKNFSLMRNFCMDKVRKSCIYDIKNAILNDEIIDFDKKIAQSIFEEMESGDGTVRGVLKRVKNIGEFYWVYDGSLSFRFLFYDSKGDMDIFQSQPLETINPNGYFSKITTNANSMEIVSHNGKYFLTCASQAALLISAFQNVRMMTHIHNLLWHKYITKVSGLKKTMKNPCNMLKCRQNKALSMPLPG